MVTFAPVYNMTFSFRDSKGQTATMRMYGTTAALDADQDALTSALTTHLQAASNAALYAVRAPDGNAGAFVQYGGTGVYQDVEDKAWLTFQDATGGIHRFSLPAPKAALFLADTETVDPSNATIALIIADFVGGSGTGKIVTKDGGLINHYVGGLRVRRRYQRRGTIFTLTPQLSPGIPEE